MAHKTLVNGTAYEIKGGRTLVNGTGYAIKGGRTLVGGTGYDISFVNYLPNFADNDWSTIIQACQTRKVPDTWTVGSQKNMVIGGETYAIDIIGKNHDDYSDGSGKAPLTFQLHDCYSETYAMNSSWRDGYLSGWAGCVMRLTHLPTILGLMPEEVQNGIRLVTKGSHSGNISNGISFDTTSDKLFLLSEIEIFGTEKASYTGEGTRYDYYKSGNSTVKNRNGSAEIWNTRSRYTSFNDSNVVINTSGTTAWNSAINSHGVSFAFCF